MPCNVVDGRFYVVDLALNNKQVGGTEGDEKTAGRLCAALNARQPGDCSYGNLKRDEWDAIVIANATKFTVMVRVGQGKWDRNECETLEEAEGVAREGCIVDQRTRMIYGVWNGHASHVKNINAGGR